MRVVKPLLLGLSFFLIAANEPGAPQQPCELRDMRGERVIRWGETIRFEIEAPWRAPYSASTHDNYRFWFDQKKDQYGFVRGRIERDGEVSLEVQVRNGASVDGDNFAVVVQIVTKDGRLLANGFARGGANAAGVCKAGGKGHSCWRWDKPIQTEQNQSPDIPAHEVDNVAYLAITPGMYDKYNDDVVWDNIKSVGRCAMLIKEDREDDADG